MKESFQLGDDLSTGRLQERIELFGGFGLPLATVLLSGILSAAAFGIQMVQHTFEMRQANVENGFKFYFDNRTALKERTDADKEMSLLKLIGNAFPNVYCDVRQDVYERVSAAEVGIVPAAAGPAPFGDADRKNLVSFLVAHDRPASPQFATGMLSVISASFDGGRNGAPTPCDPITANAPPTGTPEATLAAGENTPPAAVPAPAAGAKPADEEKVVTAQQQDNAQASNPLQPIYRVYFHIGVTGAKHTRPLDIADQFRDELANQQFRVMQGVQLVDTKILPNNPEVRYFGPAEKDAAEKLAAYLTTRFKGENLEFSAKAIGEHFPYMNPDNIEVWLPEPKGAAPRKTVAPSAAG